MAVNDPLNAQIAALKAQPYPFFLPGYSIRLTDAAVYASVAATYEFGNPVIIGLSPDAAVTLTGVAINQNMSAAGQATRPQILVPPSELNVLGVPITTADSGGTIFIPYKGFDRVVWKWQCDVEFDAVPVPSPFATGAWEQQVVSYTGTGVAGRLVPTTFSLATGVIAIWVFPQTGSGVNLSSFRTSAMTGTLVVAPGAPIKTDRGIMSLGATGFTVTDGANCPVNLAGGEYTAIVIRDTTSDQRYMRVGDYVGTGLAHNVGVGGTQPLTQLYVFGASGATGFCSDDFSAGNSLSFTTSTLFTNMITALGAGSFSLGVDTFSSDVNGNGIHFYYVAFTIPAGSAVRNLFRTFKATGTGSVVVVPSLGFTPVFAGAQGFKVGTGAATPVWRSSWNVGLTSIKFDDESGIATAGIRAFGVGTLDLGTSVAPSGYDTYGFALAGSGSVVLPPPPDPPVTVAHYDSDTTLTNVLGFGAAGMGANASPAPPIAIPGPPGSGGPAGSGAAGTLTWWGLQRFDIKPRPEEKA